MTEAPHIGPDGQPPKKGSRFPGDRAHIGAVPDLEPGELISVDLTPPPSRPGFFRRNAIKLGLVVTTLTGGLLGANAVVNSGGRQPDKSPVLPTPAVSQGGVDASPVPSLPDGTPIVIPSPTPRLTPSGTSEPTPRATSGATPRPIETPAATPEPTLTPEQIYTQHLQDWVDGKIDVPSSAKFTDKTGKHLPLNMIDGKNEVVDVTTQIQYQGLLLGGRLVDGEMIIDVGFEGKSKGDKSGNYFMSFALGGKTKDTYARQHIAEGTYYYSNEAVSAGSEMTPEQFFAQLPQIKDQVIVLRSFIKPIPESFSSDPEVKAYIKNVNRHTAITAAADNFIEASKRIYFKDINPKLSIVGVKQATFSPSRLPLATDIVLQKAP